MDRRERERILKQGAVRQDDPRDRSLARTLERDLEGSPVKGRRGALRLRNFRPDPGSYIASLGGPLPYMARLRAIESETAAHVDELARAYEQLAATTNGDGTELARRWSRLAERWSFDAVNALIEKHNRYFPAESRLPMDPRTGDFALVDGKPYRKPQLDERWISQALAGDRTVRVR